MTLLELLTVCRAEISSASLEPMDYERRALVDEIDRHIDAAAIDKATYQTHETLKALVRKKCGDEEPPPNLRQRMCLLCGAQTSVTSALR